MLYMLGEICEKHETQGLCDLLGVAFGAARIALLVFALEHQKP